MSKKQKKSKTPRKKTKSKGTSVKFPASLLKPVSGALKDRLNSLEARKNALSKEDPFETQEREQNIASPDTEAAEQSGHARTSAIKGQLDRKIVQTKKALSRVKLGTYGNCEDCGKMIDTDRLMIYPEATLCAKCQKKRE